MCGYCRLHVGRNADICDIVPEHPSLSRIHACIQMGQEGRIEIMDFKSTHGTFLNGEQVKPFVFHSFSFLICRLIPVFMSEILFNLEEVFECTH